MARPSRARKKTEAARKGGEPPTAIYVVTLIGRLGEQAMKWGAFCFIAYQGATAWMATTGKQTDASLRATLDGEISLKGILPWIVATLAVAWGLWQASVRRAVIKEMGIYKTDLEKRIDPGRTTSRLTSTGDTNPSDRLA